jgi:hypothetical protein
MVFGYRTHGRGRAASGMQVHDDGRVELGEGERWEPLTTLDADALERLREAVRGSGILHLPERTPAPANIKGGDTCELWSDLEGGVHAFVDAWADGNPAAEPSMALVMTLSGLVSAAQAATGRP